jgi:sulfoxide reductase heme-binding subunit YedZ
MQRAKVIVFIAAAAPAVALVYQAFAGLLGANPVEAITHQTGEWGLRLLLITLTITPLRRLTGINGLTRLRRMLGLFAFFYVCLHLTTYVWLDAYFDLDYILEDILDRLYITAGFAAFLSMLPLALTSTNKMIQRLGGKAWRRLHRLCYVAGIGGVLHFLWLVKADIREPLVYAVLLSLLLALRFPPIAQRLPAVRGCLQRHKSPPSPENSTGNA